MVGIPGRTSVTLLLACLLSVAHAQEADKAPPPIPAELQASVSLAEQKGRLLQRLDRAAWVATDTMRADPGAEKLLGSVRGWITESIETGTQVLFFDDSDPAGKLYRVDIESSGRIAQAAPTADRGFSAPQLALIRARRSAMAQSFLSCSRDYNSVAFAQDDAIHVYLMPGTTKAGVFPAGGHHLFTYDATGNRLQSRREFTRSCIDLQAPPDKPLKDGFQPTAMMVTHLLDPSPTEIHVFISLNSPAPLWVMTVPSRTVWKIDQGRISVLSVLDEE